MDYSKPLTLAPDLALASRVLPAPMVGLMEAVFCCAVSRLNLAHHWITPFISISRSSVPAPANLIKKLQPFQNGRPLIVQLLGHDPRSLAETAASLTKLKRPDGSQMVSGINLNFACPAAPVLKSGNGGALLKDPALMKTLIRAVQDGAGNMANISVKIRLGFDAPEPEKIAETINETGINFVMAHFRTVREQYEPVHEPLARLKTLRTALHGGITLFGNGDIRTAADAQKMAAETGCDGVLAGRGWVADPFLLKKIENGSDAPVSPEEKTELLRAVLESAQDLGMYSPAWLRHGFLGCARMCLGLKSPEFQEAIKNPEAFAGKILEKN